MSEDECDDWGDNFERPFGEGSSNGGSKEIFRVYFKGLVENQLHGETLVGGIGVAICDSRDDLLFELRKPLVATGTNRRSAEIQALIEGLNAALELQLQKLVFYCDYHPIFNYVIPDDVVQALLTACRSGNFDMGDKEVKNVIAEEGYPASQMLNQLYDVVVESEDISDEQKARICKKFGETDKCLVDGANEYMQLLDVASNIMRALNNMP